MRSKWSVKTESQPTCGVTQTDRYLSVFLNFGLQPKTSAVYITTTFSAKRKSMMIIKLFDA